MELKSVTMNRHNLKDKLSEAVLEKMLMLIKVPVTAASLCSLLQAQFIPKLQAQFIPKLQAQFIQKL